MFNPLKGLGDLKAMRDQAMAIQKQLQTITINIEKQNFDTLNISGFLVASIICPTLML